MEREGGRKKRGREEGRMHERHEVWPVWKLKLRRIGFSEPGVPRHPLGPPTKIKWIQGSLSSTLHFAWLETLQSKSLARGLTWILIWYNMGQMLRSSSICLITIRTWHPFWDCSRLILQPLSISQWCRAGGCCWFRPIVVYCGVARCLVVWCITLWRNTLCSSIYSIVTSCNVQSYVACWLFMWCT